MMSLTARSQTSAGSAGWLAPAGLLLLGMLPVIAGAFRLEQLSGISDGMPANARFAPMPLPVVLHIVSATVLSVLGPLQGLRDTGEIKPDQKVLIIGASGDVGMFAVQIAKWFGAEVTGVCSATKMDMVRSIGADHVIDYGKEDFTRSGKQYDLILDTGGNRSLSQLRRALARTGTLVIVGGEGGDRWIGGGTWRSVRPPSRGAQQIDNWIESTLTSVTHEDLSRRVSHHVNDRSFSVRYRRGSRGTKPSHTRECS